MIETILDELIKEAQQNPEWKAEQALRCTKKELLKAQEPKKVKNVIGTAVSAIGECPLCDVELNTSFLEGQRKTKFCYNCGQAVKWK